MVALNVPQPETLSLSLLKNGDRGEFTRLVEAFSPSIYQVGLRMLGNPQDAEDVLQETFLKAFRALPGFEERSSLKTWIYRIAVNESLMKIRGRKTVQVSLDGDEDDGNPERPIDLADWCCLPESEFLTAELSERMNKALQVLSPGLRSVFLLRDVQGLSIQETREALGISEASVKTRLLRARLKLREELSGYFHERSN